MKRPKKGTWTDLTERGPGYTDESPLRVAFRGEAGLYFTLYRFSPHDRWVLQCAMFDINAEELRHVELAAAQSQAISRLRREVLRITDDIDLAQRKIA